MCYQNQHALSDVTDLTNLCVEEKNTYLQYALLLNQKKEIHKQVLRELVDVMERQRKYFISELRLSAGSGFGEEAESPRYTCNLKGQFHGKTDAGRPMKGKGNI